MIFNIGFLVIAFACWDVCLVNQQCRSTQLTERIRVADPPQRLRQNGQRNQTGNLLRLAKLSDQKPARAERGVHAASTSKSQAGRVFYASQVIGR
jgi:hypothetical protein